MPIMEVVLWIVGLLVLTLVAHRLLAARGGRARGR